MKVLITGSSSGFGKLTARTLLKKGHQVAASMRNTQGRNKAAAAELAKAGAKVVDIDVTDDKSVEAGVQEAIRALGGLDAVVNNAGASMAGLQETFTVEDWKRMFELNVYGVVRVNRAALPQLRRQGSGLLIHVSSIIGRVVLPFFGPYGASKWALEALAENARLEHAGQGIDSVIVEPGGFATEIFDKLAQPSDRERVAALGEYAKAPKAFMEGFGKTLAEHPEQKPQDVADAIVKLIETPAGRRPFRTVVDKLGMGAAIAPYNEAHEKLKAGLFSTLGLADMTRLKEPVG